MVAGIRTPMPIKLMADVMPPIYAELVANTTMLEKHMKDMQVGDEERGVACAHKECASDAVCIASARARFSFCVRWVLARPVRDLPAY